jgi:hypothetical protein
MYNAISVVIFHFSWKTQSDVWVTQRSSSSSPRTSSDPKPNEVIVYHSVVMLPGAVGEGEDEGLGSSHILAKNT